MNSNKAAGKDGVPAEVYKASEPSRRDLFTLVKLCWSREITPESLPEGIFIPIYKQGKVKDDFRSYRFICLLSHAYKVLST